MLNTQLSPDALKRSKAKVYRSALLKRSVFAFGDKPYILDDNAEEIEVEKFQELVRVAKFDEHSEVFICRDGKILLEPESDCIVHIAFGQTIVASHYMGLERVYALTPDLYL